MAASLWLLVPISIVTVIMQVACAVKLVRFARRRCFARACEAICRFVGGHFGDQSNSEISGKMREVLLSRRMECARAASFFVWVTMCVMSFQVLAELMQPGDWMVVDNSIYIRTTLLLLFAVPANVPKGLNSMKSAGALQVMGMAVICFQAFQAGLSSTSLHRSIETSTGAVFFSFLCLDVRFHLLPNIAVTLCFVAANYIHDADDPNLMKNINFHIFMFVGRLGVCLFAELALVHLVRQEVEASMGKCHHSAVFRLLDMLCDAVVDLDGSLRLKSHYPKLAGMLMHSSDRSLKDKLLADFIPEHNSEDRARFGQMLQQTEELDADAPLSPSVATMPFADCIGNRISCALFHVPYITISGQLHHLVGLREDGDINRQMETQTSAPEAILRDDIARLLKAIPPPPTRALRSGSARSSEHSNRSRRSAGNGGNRAPRPRNGQSAEIYLAERLPVRWIAEELRQQLNLDEVLDDRLPEFGDLFPDGGQRLLDMIKETISAEPVRADTGRRHTEKCLGPWRLLPRSASAADGAQPAQVITRVLWVQFRVPPRENESSMPFVAIAATSPEGSSGDLGPSSAGRTTGAMVAL